LPIFNKNKNYLLLHLVVFIWGFAGIFGRSITLPASHLIWYRMLIASAGIFVFLIANKISLKASPAQLLRFAGVGILIAIHWLCFYQAIKISTISLTLACFSCGALFTALIEPLLFRRKVNWIEIAYGLVVILSISLIFSFETKFKLGILLSVFSALLSAFFTVLNAGLVKKNNSTVMTFYELFFGFIAVGIYLLITGEYDAGFFQIGQTNLLLLLLFSLVATAFTFVISSSILKEISPYTFNLTVNLEVVYGIILAFLIFRKKELMGTGFYAATAMILLTLFANAWMKQKQASKPKAN